MLCEFVEFGIGETEARPVDIEAPEYGVGELQRDIRRHGLAERAGPPGPQQQTDVLVARQPLERGGDAFGDRLDRIADALQVPGESIQE